MKRNILVILISLLIIACSTYGQPRENLVQGEVDNGFFVGQTTKLTKVDGVFTSLPGVRAGWIIGHRFSIGAAAYVMLDKTEANFKTPVQSVELLLAYGGLQMMYTPYSERLFHWEIGTLVGFGGLNYSERGNNLDLPNSSHIFVLEPEASLVLNVSNFVQVSSGLSYRWIIGNLEEEVVRDKDISGPALALGVSFGLF